MTDTTIYKDIAQRTGGDIYIGVVGPVRTGKSTFIKKFFETLIIPHMPADYERERMIDELPQSSAGRTIMTTEPKFVSEKAIRIALDDQSAFTVRLVDCVGYIVPSSLGYIENEAPRMVKTPWFEDEIPFNMAAEIGTKKVINEHATIGLVITTDGSIGEIPREEYEEAEERVISELNARNKPYVILLNCVYPQSASAQKLAQEMREKYDASVIPINCLSLSEDEIREILGSVLYEFPVKKIEISLPGWLSGMPEDAPLKNDLMQFIRTIGSNTNKMKDIKRFVQELREFAPVTYSESDLVALGEGSAYITAEIDRSHFYGMISNITGFEIGDDIKLINALKELADTKKRFCRIETALEQVNSTGYGIVMPSIEEMELEEPEIMRQGNRYGVRLKASAPSIHMLRADIQTEVAPIVGSEKQSEDLVKYLLDGFRADPSKLWESA